MKALSVFVVAAPTLAFLSQTAVTHQEVAEDRVGGGPPHIGAATPSYLPKFCRKAAPLLLCCVGHGGVPWQLWMQGEGASTAAVTQSVRPPLGLPFLALTPPPCFAAMSAPRVPLYPWQEKPSVPTQPMQSALASRQGAWNTQSPSSYSVSLLRKRRRMYMKQTH